jgi:ferritin-like protein
MASEGFHEPVDRLSPETLDRHRAIISLMEEFEAIDWYDQRVDATDDESLAAILAHNRDEEKEHAAMTLEWLRRHDPVLDEQLRTYLFTEGSITDVEDEAMGREPGTDPGSTATEGLGIGSLRVDDLPPSRPLPD